MQTTRSRTENQLFQTIANLLEWCCILQLALLNLLLLSQSCGYGPEPLMPAVLLCAGMVLCHLLWQVLDRSGCALKIHPFVFWLLPLWGILVAHAFASPAPWQAQYEAIIATVALIAFWIAAHHLRQPAHIYTVLISIAAPLALAIVFAMLQGLAHLEGRIWVLDLVSKRLIGTSSEIAAEGIASGLFHSNQSFAALLAIVLPLAAVYALAVRLRPGIRIGLLGLCWFGLCALILAQDLTALLIAAAALFAAPFIARSRDMEHKPALALVAAVLLTALLAVYTLSPQVRLWIASGLPDARYLQSGLAAGGWSMFTDNILFGVGLGNFANAFEAYRPQGFVYPQVGQPSLLIKLLAETGLLGTAAAAALCLWLPFRMLALWRTLPNAVKKEEEDIELAGRRYCQPLRTVSTGASLLAALTAIALLLCGNPLQEAALAVVAFSLLGLGAAQLPLRHQQVRQSRYSGQLLAATGLAIAILLPALTLPSLVSRLYTQQTQEVVSRWQQLDAFELQGMQQAIQGQRRRMEKALLLAPNNAMAWICISHLHLLQIRSATDSARHSGELAEQAARQAADIHPLYLPAWMAIANARQAAGDLPAAEQALQQAITCAPRNAYCWYRLADLLKQAPNSRDKALDAINRALEIDPANQLAQQVHRQLLIP